MTVQVAPRNTRLEIKPEQSEFEVLVVEDEDLMSALILRYLESSVIPTLGYKPRIRILDRGWDLLQSDLSNVRVAVVDLLLPQVTGIDLIRNFRSRYPNMGIVPISGMATEPMRRNLNEILKGDFGLIDKPLRKETFKSAFVKAWNYWSPPKTGEFSFEEKEPSWNAVSAGTNSVKTEKRRLPRRPTDPQDPSQGGSDS
jgi:CheY-like chemotaxis protein